LITTEIRLFLQRCRARRIVGITGTKGKSTTTAMLGAMLSRKFRTHVGATSAAHYSMPLPEIAEDDIVVLEFIELHAGASPGDALVAACGADFTMLAKDHLEWHGSVEAYHSAKAVLLEFQKARDFAVLNQNDPASQKLADKTAATVKWFGANSSGPFELKIPGIHNQINAQGAFAAASCLGISRKMRRRRCMTSGPCRIAWKWFTKSAEFAFTTTRSRRFRRLHRGAGIVFRRGESFKSWVGHLKDLSTAAMCQALAQRAKAAICVGEKGPGNRAEFGALPRRALQSFMNARTWARQFRWLSRLRLRGISCCFPPAARVTISSSISSSAARPLRAWRGGGQ